MLTKFFRYSFICVVFVSGVLIGGIYAPEIATVSDAENHQLKKKSQESKPTKSRPGNSVSFSQDQASLTPDRQYQRWQLLFLR